MTLTADLVVPIMATLSFVFAAALAVVASLRGGENPACVTYADVAGAITLIGVCIAATIEPEQMAAHLREGFSTAVTASRALRGTP